MRPNGLEDRYRLTAWWFRSVKAIAYEVNLESDRPRYRKLALAALKSLARPTEAMVDAAYEVLWFDAFWAINSRADFKEEAVQAMIRVAMTR
jgi:hypothetical protein